MFDSLSMYFLIFLGYTIVLLFRSYKVVAFYTQVVQILYTWLSAWPFLIFNDFSIFIHPTRISRVVIVVGIVQPSMIRSTQNSAVSLPSLSVSAIRIKESRNDAIDELYFSVSTFCAPTVCPFHR